jgi:hypothetical protein
MVGPHDLLDWMDGPWCRRCERRTSEFKLSYRNPRHGLCDKCEDDEPLEPMDA